MTFHLMDAIDLKLVRQWQEALWLIVGSYHNYQCHHQMDGIFWCLTQFTRANSGVCMSFSLYLLALRDSKFLWRLHSFPVHGTGSNYSRGH